MPRPSRAAAAKAVKYVDEALSDEGDEDDTELTDASESASVASSSRKGRAQQDQEDDAWSQDGDSDHPPARKKARPLSSSSKSATKSTTKAKGKGRGKMGKLSAFLAMPLDILVEISRHLDPPSLLHMSRANKMMRGVFAHRSAAPIWAIVRGNVDLPALEATDLSEMQLASLLYERNCHLCGRGRASIVDYALRVRWCKKCQRANLDNESRIRRKVENLHENALECSPFTHRSLSGYNSNNKPYYCTPHVERINIKLHELDSRPLKKPLKKKKKPGKKRKHEDEDDDFESSEDEMDEVDNGELEAFVKQRHDDVAASQRDAVTLVNWERSSLVTRKESDEAARAARKEANKQKLLDLGYSDADCVISPYSSVYNLVDQPTHLTKSIWTRISPKIIEHVEAQKQRRLADESCQRCKARHAALRPRYDHLLAAQQGDAHVTFPSYSIFNSLPSVEPFWVPDDVEATDAEWSAALPAILAEVDLARRAIKVGYARQLVKNLAETDAPVDAVLASKLTLPPGGPVRPIGVLLEAASAGNNYHMLSYLGTSSLDLADTADGVRDADFDGLFSRLVAYFWLRQHHHKKLAHFPAVHAAHRDENRSAVASSGVQLNVLLAKQILDVLKRTGLPDHVSSLAKLEALGSEFSCHRCLAVFNPYLHNWNKPLRTSHGRSDLYWSELVDHLTNQHRTSYTSHHWSYYKPPEIRLSTSTYAPAPPRAPAPTRKPLNPFHDIAADELEA
ncbi:hypothetical protein JCM9279_007013 [Rhodotorula babjevae]